MATDTKVGGSRSPSEVKTDKRRIAASDLLQGHREVIIEHRGQEYRLRVTAADKLILTK